MQAWSVSGEDPLWGCGLPTSHYILTGRRAENSGVFLIRALIPFTRALPSRPNHLSKAPSPNRRVRISTCEFWGYKHSVNSIDFEVSNVMGFN